LEVEKESYWPKEKRKEPDTEEHPKGANRYPQHEADVFTGQLSFTLLRMQKDENQIKPKPKGE
jgi:hypothetical protein